MAGPAGQVDICEGLGFRQLITPIIICVARMSFYPLAADGMLIGQRIEFLPQIYI
jgi:hypothetical protein